MQLPGSQDRISIFGRTGSGKTTAAVWHLSLKDFKSMPWIVFNHKRTRMVDSIPGAQFMGMDEFPKKGRGGLYIYHPVPEFDDEKMTGLMWKILQTGHIGVYFDEGYMVNPRDHALTALYTQGRELHIPMITLSQRPTKISRFGVSEADFYQLFHLVDKRDRETVNAFIPYSLEKLMVAPPGTPRALPEYHSVYFDVGANHMNICGPVPDEETILAVFADKLILSKTKNHLL